MDSLMMIECLKYPNIFDEIVYLRRPDFLRMVRDGYFIVGLCTKEGSLCTMNVSPKWTEDQIKVACYYALGLDFVKVDLGTFLVSNSITFPSRASPSKDGNSSLKDGDFINIIYNGMILPTRELFYGDFVYQGYFPANETPTKYLFKMANPVYVWEFDTSILFPFVHGDEDRLASFFTFTFPKLSRSDLKRVIHRSHYLRYFFRKDSPTGIGYIFAQMREIDDMMDEHYSKIEKSILSRKSIVEINLVTRGFFVALERVGHMEKKYMKVI